MLCEQNSEDAGLVTRFRLEAEAGRRLNHPAIIRTRDAGTSPGLYGQVHYMVMDLVRGVGVDEFVALGGPIAWPVACHIAQHVAAGLHHAHRNGLVHRDLKPSNILVDELSNAHILDFGLSVASQSELGDEFSLAMIFGQDCLGTADYIAPEQARDSFQVDRRADLYSLGATMYFMLAGRVLFPDCEKRSEKLEAHWNREPQPIGELVPGLPAGVAQIVHKLLAKDREQRFATAREVAVALQPFAEPKKVTFNFQQILDRRFAIARQRERLWDARAKRAAAASGLSVCSVDSKATRPTQAQMETVIRKDTKLGTKADGSKTSPSR
jgi:serine/threonine-protein kinase